MLKSVLLSGLLSTAAISHVAAAEVVHWLTSGGEAKAIGVLADEFKARGGTWTDNPSAGASAARQVTVNKIAGGNPPAAVQWTIGAAVKEFASQDLLQDLDDVAAANDWKKNLPPLIVDNLSYDGKIYAVPVDLHGGNWMFYSLKIFNELKLTPPKSWSEFLAMADQIKAAGYTPIAVGSQPWQQNWLFLSVLIGEGGKELQKQILGDLNAEAAGSAGVVKSFETFRKLKAYIDADSPNRKWNDTLKLVANDQAALQIIGDWGKGEFAAAGKVPDKDYGCALAPGNDAYVMVVDVFMFPKGNEPAHVEEQKKLAQMMMDPVVQAKFNSFKGALPPRLDADVSSLDSCAKLGQSILAQGEASQLPDYELMLPPDTVGQVTDLINAYWNDSSITPEDAAKQLSGIIAAAK